MSKAHAAQSQAIERAVAHLGSAAALARSAGGVAPAFVYMWRTGLRPIPPQRCVLIEAACRKADPPVTRSDLRPDDWHLIWPELRRRKGAPRVSASPRDRV